MASRVVLKAMMIVREDGSGELRCVNGPVNAAFLSSCFLGLNRSLNDAIVNAPSMMFETLRWSEPMTRTEAERVVAAKRGEMDE